MNNNETVYVKRPKDGAIIGIPAHTLEATLRQGFTLVEEIAASEPAIEQSPAHFGCPLCEKTFETERSLKAHKTKSHK